MKRLVVTGLPCPKEAWVDFLGDHPDQHIIPVREVLENTTSSDPREMSRYITEKMEKLQPDSVIAHDLGVPLTLLSLLRLNRRGLCTHTRVTLFNGAFRRVNLWKANHIFRMQLWSQKRAIKMVENVGGKVDLGLEPFMNRIRSVYRILIFFGVTERLSSLIGLDDLVDYPARSTISTPFQIIASANDPFIPWEAIEQLRDDLEPRRFTRIDYGHFPYTLPREKFLPLIEGFESDYTPGPKPAELSHQPSRTLY